MDFDDVTTKIAEFAELASRQPLEQDIVDAGVRHHLDSVACMFGGLNSKPGRIARSIAKSAITSPGCSVPGIEKTVAPEQATFANSTFVRQLDFNDVLSLEGEEGGGHPSDVIPGVVAAAEIAGKTGMDVINGIYVAYEVFASLVVRYPLRKTGWDQGGTFVAVASAVGAGALLGLCAEEFANAVSVAITSSMMLGSTRKGELSNWKGCASTKGAADGLFAARLAKAGLSAPSAPFQGIDGLDQKVKPAKDFSIGGRRSAVETAQFKQYPCVGLVQPVIKSLISVRDEIAPNDVASIAIDTYNVAWSRTGGGDEDPAKADKREKWNPTSRETADHSMPYLAAIGLLDGEVVPSSFAPSRIVDPTVRALMARISVDVRDDLTALYPRIRRSEIRVTLQSGRIIDLVGQSEQGSDSTMSDEELSVKFRQLSRDLLEIEAVALLEENLWNLARLQNVSPITQFYSSINIED